MFSKLAAAALLALAVSPSWAINKCTGPDGSVVFQDAPCAGKGGAIVVRPASGNAPASNADAAERTRLEVAKINRRSETNAAIARGEPLVGMTRAELDQAMGAPTKINSNNYAGVLHDQLIYQRPQATWMIYTESGVVTSIQHRPASNNVAAGPSVRCPTPFEIRGMQVSANSNSLSAEERLERQKQITEAMRCGR
jgi:hypothetical protein